jgi:pimeloyl-ACP methyl ester carboxylesterase
MSVLRDILGNKPSHIGSRTNIDGLTWKETSVGHTLVFIHGSGRAGVDNWPSQAEAFDSALFLTMPGYGDESPTATDMDAWVDRVLSVEGDLDIIAHSYGGLPALLAASRAQTRVKSLTLFEPAAYSYARGEPGVEEMISRMGPVVASAPSMNAADYHVRFVSTLTGTRPPAPAGAAELAAAERIRLLAAPWSFQMPSHVPSHVPTLVLTGSWNQEYEQIGQAMTSLGARHEHLIGFGHRVQDHPEANSVIANWLAI